MADENDLPIPKDIPWQLLSRRGPESVEDPTSLSTFVHIPSLPELDAAYPDDRIVYFKVSASVFPFYLKVPRVSPLFLDETFAPVWRLVLDVEIAPQEGAAGLKPYFLSAAPTRRAIVETGVVGDHLLEGESDEVAIGKSASHLIEGFHSTTKTRKLAIGGGIGGLAGRFNPWAIGGSYSRGTTSITGGRETTEQLDTTNRQSSEERKELLSHMTNVNNVLTLLTGSLVGTNRLRFSLWPQPLRPLSIDPTDENLWYAELLKRRSSGIEGMQDVFAVAVIPRGEGFCLLETLRRVSVVEPPLPQPPVRPLMPFDKFDFTTDNQKVSSYITGKYPPGTPLEELDVSVEDQLLPDPNVLPPFPAPGQRTRANLQAWYDTVSAFWTPNPYEPLPPFNPLLDVAVLKAWVDKVVPLLGTPPTGVKIRSVPRPVVSEWSFFTLPTTPPRSNVLLEALTDPKTLPAPYKWAEDVWLEAAQYEYETELAKPPLERGALLIEDRRVDICADLDEDGAIGEVTTTIPPSPGIGVLPPLPPTLIVRSWDSSAVSDPRAKGRAMVSAWAAAEAQLTTRLAGAARALGSFSFQNPRIVDVLLRRAERLAAGDKRNVPLAELSRRLGFSGRDVQQLKAAGVSNLSSLASSILAAQRTSKRLAPRVAQSVVRAIGVTLDALWQKQEQTGARRSQRTHRHTRRRVKRSRQ